MKILENEHFIEIFPENKYILNIETGDVLTGACAKKLNIENYKDITDFEAETLIKEKQAEEQEQETDL